MKNKKLVLSVLSTAVVASMATSAFAAPQAGIYIGGNLNKLYKSSDILRLSDTAFATFKQELIAADRNQVVIVKADGKGASIQEILSETNAWDEALVEGDFSASYSVVGLDGNTAGSYDARKEVTPAPAGELKVESVSAINLKQVEVKFNNELDEASAELVGNYTYTGGTTILGAPVLQADKKTVLLTLTAAEANQATATLKVENVKDAKGASIASTTKTISFLDTTLPTVVSTKLVAPTKVQIKFSEPVTATTAFSNAAFQLDNNTYSLGAAPVLATGTLDTIELTLGSVLPAGEHTIKINPTGTPAGNQVKDFAGFAVNTFDAKFTYATDTTAPVATVSVLTQTSATIKFDKDVSLVGGGTLNTDFTVYHTINNQASYKGTAVLTDSKTLTVTFGTPIPSGNVTLYLNNNVVSATAGLADAFGNKVATSTLSGAVSSDTTKPTVTEVKYINSTTVDVSFSEAVTGVAASNFTLKDSTNTAVAVTNAVNTTGNTYRLTTAALNGDTYTLSIAADSITDTALVPNKIAAYSTTITVADTAAPTVTGTGSYSADGKKVFVSFSEKMATTGAGSVLDVNNYRFSTNVGANPSAFPTGTTIALGADQKSVVVTFPAAVVGLGSGNFAGVVVGQVRDLAGNATANLSNQVVLAGADLTAANIVAGSVKAISRNVVQFQVNSNLTAIDVAKFTVDGAAATSATYVNNAGVSTVTVTGPANQWKTDISDLDASAVVIAIGGLTNDQNVSNGAIVNVTGTKDYIAPTVVSRGIADTNANGKYDTVTVTFSEALQASSVAYDAFTVEGYTVSNVVTSADTATLTLTELSVSDAGATPKVQLVKAVRDNSAQFNVLAAETVGTAVAKVVTGAAGTASVTTQGSNGTAQVETATAAGTVTTAGDVTVTVTAAGMAGSPKAIPVAVALADDANAIAGKIRTALAADTDVNALFNVTGTAADIVLTAKTVAINDGTLNVAIANGTSAGVTAAATSADTTTGVAPITEVATLVVSAGAASNGSIAVTVDGATTWVAVAAGDTAAQVATKIATALTVAGYNDIAAGANVTFTATTPGAKTDLVITVAN